jgi:hypothetical protein
MTIGDVLLGLFVFIVGGWALVRSQADISDYFRK